MSVEPSLCNIIHCTMHNVQGTPLNCFSLKKFVQVFFSFYNSCAVGFDWGFRIAVILVSVLNSILSVDNVPFGYLFTRLTVFDGVNGGVFVVVVFIIFLFYFIHRICTRNSLPKNWKTMNRHCWVVYSFMESNRIEWNGMHFEFGINSFIAYF